MVSISAGFDWAPTRTNPVAHATHKRPNHSATTYSREQLYARSDHVEASGGEIACRGRVTRVCLNSPTRGVSLMLLSRYWTFNNNKLY